MPLANTVAVVLRRIAGLALIIGFLAPAAAGQAGVVTNQRLFATDAERGIIEIDPADGRVLRAFATPAEQGVSDALAFDGSSLWYISGSRASNTLYQLNPDSGAELASFTLPSSRFRNGLAAQNGLVYILDWSVLTQAISVFDPVSATVVNTLDIDQINPDAPLVSGGLAAIGDPNALLVTTSQTAEILEINATTGRIDNRFAHGQGGASGLAVVTGRIFLATNSGATLTIFDRAGRPQGSIEVADSIGMQSLAGDEGSAVAQDDPLFSDQFESAQPSVSNKN